VYVPGVVGVPDNIAAPFAVTTLTIPDEVKPEKSIPGGTFPINCQDDGSAIVPVTVNTAVAAIPVVAVKEVGVVTMPEAPTSVCTAPREAAATTVF
jgi:hypothetical protein